MNTKTFFKTGLKSSKSNGNPRHVDALTINWHVTEACNFQCKYCYAHWESPEKTKDLFKDSDQVQCMLRTLFAYVDPQNSQNSLKTQLTYDRVRLTIAGGEPLLLGTQLVSLVKIATSEGFSVSIITNGSLLDDELAMALAPHIEWVGISLDSVSVDTNTKIGRLDRKQNLIDIDRLSKALQLMREINPRLKIKLNTVVNTHNHTEDIGDLLKKIQPERWKIMRVLPVYEKETCVTDQQFADYVNRHAEWYSIQTVEDNADMTHSYLMLDPKGRFFQNQASNDTAGYSYSDPILSLGVGEALDQIAFDPALFASRYS